MQHLERISIGAVALPTWEVEVINVGVADWGRS